MKDPADYLRELLTELDDVQAFTMAGREHFMENRMTQKAVIRSYEVIGEIVKRLPQRLRDDHPEVNWRTLAGFRDFLIHNYDEVVLENVWAAVEDIPRLRPHIETILADHAD